MTTVTRGGCFAVAALSLLAVAGCREHTVQVSFRPEIGATYRYEVEVRSVTRTTLEGARTETRHEKIVLQAEHTVLAAGPDGVRVRVVLGEPGLPAQGFVVRFDRAAQLESVESTQGVPEEVVGTLGISEIFPAAAGPPPGRRLAPGDTWTVDDEVLVPGALEPSRLRGDGRLVELGLVGGEKVARLRSTARLPLVATAAAPTGAVILDGQQEIEQSATYDLDDGAVRSATSSTVGRFTIEVEPPPGTAGDPVPGVLEVEVQSTTRRVR